MEDENGLELSLALPCGGSSAISKVKNESSLDTGIDKGERGNKLTDDFKNFLHGGTQKLDCGMGSQRSDPVKSEENFFNDLSKAAVNVDASTNMNSGGYWVANDSSFSEVEEKTRAEAGSKSKNFFGEINHQKKRKREAHHTDLPDKTRTSHISITTDEGSTAENEDVADFEAEGTSRLVSHDNGSKRHTGGGGLSEVPKMVNGVPDSNGIDLQGQNGFTISSQKEFKHGNMSYGFPFSPQSVNIMNMPYSFPEKDSDPTGAPVTSSYSLPGYMQVMAAANIERPGNQTVMPASFPLMFGCYPFQAPMLDKDNSQHFVSHSQQLHTSYFGRGQPNSDKQNDGSNISQVPGIPHKSSETIQYDGRTLEQAKGDDKQHAAGECLSSQAEDDSKGSSSIFRGIDTSDQQRAGGFPPEFQAIRPGFAGDLKFGGCGSTPNLPWVTATAPGPNGRTISGVTYRYCATQMQIVCACHGSHMSPEEFVRHAGEDQTSTDIISARV